MADEGPTKDELKEMHEGLFGKAPRQTFHFVTQMWLDVEESLRRERETGDHKGSRTEIPRVFMATVSAGLKYSRNYYLATDEDIAAHPQEFAAYLEEIKRGNQQDFCRWPLERTPENQRQADHLPGLQGPVGRTAGPGLDQPDTGTRIGAGFSGITEPARAARPFIGAGFAGFGHAARGPG